VSEIWKDVLGYEGLYQVSDMGGVMRVAGGQGAVAGLRLKPQLNTSGYLQVNLYECGKRTLKCVHRLVLEAHVGPTPEGCEGNHRNGNKHDNRAKNLEWLTPAENTRHAFQELGHEGAKGEDNGNSKCTAESAIEIRELYATGKFMQAELGEKFGLAQTTISDIVNRRTWKSEG